MSIRETKLPAVRVGFIGAGAIARERHLPALAKMQGVKLVAVANRSLQSASQVTSAYGGDAMLDWRELIQRQDIDAVFIGTWPYMHQEMSVASLQAGKHVFCQARMAMDLAQARTMLAAAEAHPTLVNMICPPPTRMPFEPYVRDLLAQKALGRIINVQLTATSDANLQSTTLHWREDIHYSGRQIMMVGILAETLNAWLGPYDTLTATTDIVIRHKKDQCGHDVQVHVPQVVQIQGRLHDGVPISEHHNGLVIDPESHKTELIIRGLEGTLRYRFGQVIELARPGRPFEPVSVPVSLQRPWLVEADFIHAVRQAMTGQPWQVSPDFAEGLLYMRKMEAIHESARQGGRPVQPATL